MQNTTFNAKRPYGVVSGHAEIRYEQDGKLFRHDGSLYSPGDPVKVSEPVVEAKVEEVKLEPTSNDKRSDAMRRIWAERRAAQARAAEEEME